MLRLVLWATLATTAAFAQNVISAKAGLVNYHDGDVQVAGEQIQSKPSQFTSLKIGQELRTGEGRAELLLTPGVFMRVGENSAVRMISNSLTEPKVALIQGSALVQAADVAKDAPITVTYGDRAVLLSKAGIYRFDASDAGASIRVYEGEARAGEVDVKRGRELSLTGSGDTKEIAKFDTKDTDELYRWASRRDQYIAMANVSAAKSAASTGGVSSCAGSYSSAAFSISRPYGNYGYGISPAAAYGGYGGYYGQQGGWRYNPCYGMFTYVPYNGIYMSPFGWQYYSPTRVVYLYNPMNYSRGNGAAHLPSNASFGHGGGFSNLPTSYPSQFPSGQGVGYQGGNSVPTGAGTPSAHAPAASSAPSAPAAGFGGGSHRPK